MNRSFVVVIAVSSLLAGCAASEQTLSDDLIAEIRRGPETVLGADSPVPIDGSKTLPLVATRINGQGPFRLLVDLGSNVSVLRRDVAVTAGAEVLVDRERGDIFRAAATFVGETEFRNTVFATYEELDVDGVLGFNALDDHPFTLDYPGMAFAVGGESLPKPASDPLVFEYVLERRMPFLPAHLGERELKLNFDTGASGWIVLPAAMKKDLPLAGAPVPGFSVFNNQTGSARVELARLNGDLRFGPMILPDPMVQFDPDVEEPFVGSSLLAHFRLTFDPANRRVRMEPVTDGSVHVPGFATFGVKIVRDAAGLAIDDVIPGTPAAKAGVERGTPIVAINGADAGRLGNAAIEAVNHARGLERLELVMRVDSGIRGVQLERVVLAGPGRDVTPSRVEDLATVAATSGAARRMDQYLTAMEALGFSGAIIAEHQGNVVLRKGYGLADRETRRAYTPTTVQTHGSITKQMTGAAVLLLESRGELSVEDAVTEYFDDVPEDKRGITLHHLLTHSAGLPGSIGRDNEPVGAEEYVERVMAADLQFEPGSNYSYSNVGFALLGVIVERVSGKDYEQFLREELLLPAGLSETGYLLPDWDRDRLAVGYQDGERWGLVYKREWRDDGPGWHLRANGGLHTTVDDMHRWLATVKGDGVLPPRAAERWTTGYVDEGGGDSKYAYGWAVHDTELGPMIAHNGGNGIYSADFVWLPEEEFFFYVQGNTSVILASRLRDALLGAAFDDANRMPPLLDPAVDAEPAAAKGREGIYRLAAGTIELTTDDTRLIAGVSGQGALDLILGHDADQRKHFTALNRRTMEVMNKLRAGREDAFEGLVQEGTDPVGRAQGMLNVIERGGELKSLTLVGSIENVPGSRFAEYGSWTTFVRAEFDRGVRMWGVLWREDETYRGTAIGPPSDVPSLILVPTGEGRYTGVRREPPWDTREFEFRGSCLVSGELRACK